MTQINFNFLSSANVTFFIILFSRSFRNSMLTILKMTFQKTNDENQKFENDKPTNYFTGFVLILCIYKSFFNYFSNINILKVVETLHLFS